MADSFSIKALLSAKDAGFSSGMKGALASLKDFSTEIKSGIKFGALSEIGSKAVSAVTGSISGMTKGVVDAGMSFESAMSSVAAISDRKSVV